MSQYYVSGYTKGVRHIGGLIKAPNAARAVHVVIEGYTGFPKRPQVVQISRFSDRDGNDSGRYGIYESAGMHRISNTGDAFDVDMRSE